MSANKSSLGEQPSTGAAGAQGVRGLVQRGALRNGVAHYQRAALMVSHAETLDSLRRAQAAFGEAGERAAAARCVELRRQVEAGGLDELPALSELLRR